MDVSEQKQELPAALVNHCFPSVTTFETYCLCLGRIDAIAISEQSGNKTIPLDMDRGHSLKRVDQRRYSKSTSLHFHRGTIKIMHDVVCIDITGNS